MLRSYWHSRGPDPAAELDRRLPEGANVLDLPRLLRPSCNMGLHAMCSPWSGLDVLAEAAVHHAFEGLQPAPAEPRSLHAATLPPKVVKKLLSLEFVEMNELRADIWSDDPAPTEGGHTPPAPGQATHYEHPHMDSVLRTYGGSTITVPREGSRALGLPNNNSTCSPRQ